jgi:hypothetical protein
MKAVLGVVGGFVLTLAMFASGVVFAVWTLTAKPVDRAAPAASVAELWTKDAQPVDKAALNLARVPATQPAAPDAAARAQETPAQETAQQSATLVANAAPAEEEQAALPAAHVSWCANRYRSYSPEDNSYISYSGQQRPCVSPYLNANDNTADETGDESVQTATQVGYAETGDMVSATNLSSVSAGHIESCFGRYRSYRPEDNTYQPYSGGPRRQCE